MTAPDAEAVSDLLKRRVLAALEANGHLPCEYATGAVYVPESTAAVCGCGHFVDLQLSGPTESPQATGGEQGRPYEAADPIQATLALIDPTEHYTPADVERHILEVLYRLETGALYERQTITNHHRAEVAFERAYWRAHDETQDGAADRRKASAMVACEREHTAMLEAKYAKEAAKQTMHNLRAVLSGYQSVARSVGAAYSGGGSAGRPT